MTNWDKAINFVRQRGNRLDKLRLRRAIGESYTIFEAEEILSSYQFSDGSWDYDSPEGKSSRIGSLGGTIHCLRWIREFGIEDSYRMILTLEFLKRIQSPDGSFYETEAKLAHSPQKWLQKKTLIDHFYFTAAVPMRLFSLGYNEPAVIEPALKWLRTHWQDWDTVAGTWYRVWALLCLNKHNIGLEELLYKRCYEYTQNRIPRLNAQPLTWLLDALQGAGFTEEEQLVKNGIARLFELQSENGIWLDSEYSTVETTITALRLLRDYNVEQWIKNF